MQVDGGGCSHCGWSHRRWSHRRWRHRRGRRQRHHGGGRGGRLVHEALQIVDDLAQRLQRAHDRRLHLGHSGALVLHGGENLHALDGVDAEVALEVHVQLEHLGRVARLLRDHLEHQRVEIDGGGRGRQLNHWGGRRRRHRLDHRRGGRSDRSGGDHRRRSGREHRRRSGRDHSGLNCGEHCGRCGEAHRSRNGACGQTRQRRQRGEGRLHGREVRPVALDHALLESGVRRCVLTLGLLPRAQPSRREGHARVRRCGHGGLHGGARRSRGRLQCR